MKNILTDILLEPDLSSSEIILQDIDPKRLNTSQVVANKIISSLRVNASIEITDDRQKALKNADFVVVMIQVGGYKPSTVIDFEIPAKYGLQQTIADTLGIGGIMRGLRTAPVLIEIAQDMMELCPEAVMLQYANPMAINCLALIPTISSSSPVLTIPLSTLPVTTVPLPVIVKTSSIGIRN